MLTNPTAPAIFFHCAACGGRIQTPAQFAGVSAPCPFCSSPVTAPIATANDWAPAPIRRLVLPELQTPPRGISRGEQQVGPIQDAPRVNTPPQEPHDVGERATAKLGELFESMGELEDQLNRRIRKKAPFDGALGRTETRRTTS